MSSGRGQDTVLDPQLMPSGAEGTSAAAGSFADSLYAQHSYDTGVNVGYRQNQPYYIADPRVSTGSMDERPVEQEDGYSPDDAQQEYYQQRKNVQSRP